MQYLFKNLLLYSRFRQTKCIAYILMTKKESTNIVNFMTHVAGVLVPGRGSITFVVKMHYFFKNLLL